MLVVTVLTRMSYATATTTASAARRCTTTPPARTQPPNRRPRPVGQSTPGATSARTAGTPALAARSSAPAFGP
ncbi:hypothetical protein PNP59_00740 [Halobacterium salinarum]|nr:hypothetical protein [Halobacterium salinarum]MDL0129460.1 hypothetical protein [Halobacterium salinarum]